MSDESQNSSVPIEAEAQASDTNDSSADAVESQASPEAAAEKLQKLEAKPESKLTKTEKKTLRNLQLKVDGKIYDEQLPFELPEDAAEYMTRQLQLAKVSQKRMSDHSDLQKQVGQLIEELRKNPRKILSDPNIGIDVKQFAAQILQEELENSKKSPELIEKEKLEQRLREIEEERTKEREDLQKREFEMVQNQAYEEYDRQITSALESSNLPKSPYIVKKMADYMLMGLQEGLDVKAKDVLSIVEEEMKNDLRQMFQVLPEDVIEKLVGKDVLGKLRKKNVAKIKSAMPNKKVPDVGMKRQEEKPIVKKSYRDFFKI